MRILFIGDFVGSPSKRAVRTLLPSLRSEYDTDPIIDNGENIAGGFGLTPEMS